MARPPDEVEPSAHMDKSVTGESVCSVSMLLKAATKSQNLAVVCFRPSRDSDENISFRTLLDSSN